MPATAARWRRASLTGSVVLLICGVGWVGVGATGARSLAAGHEPGPRGQGDVPPPTVYEGVPDSLFGGPHSDEGVRQPKGFTVAALEANAHDNLLQLFGPQIDVWEAAYARRAHSLVHDILTTQKLQRAPPTGRCDSTPQVAVGRSPRRSG